MGPLTGSSLPQKRGRKHSSVAFNANGEASFVVHPREPVLSTHNTPKTCKCKNSRCLKLYCECFANRQYCSGCSCTCCNNTPEHDEIVQLAVSSALERNPKAFRNKIEFFLQLVRVEIRMQENIVKDVTVGRVIVLKNIVNVFKQIFYVEKIVGVVIVKIMEVLQTV